MKRVLFGQDYLLLQPSELIKSTTKTCLIHIASARRIRELFSINGLTFGEYITKQYKYSFCGKMNLKDKRTNIHISAYVIDETNDKVLLISRAGTRIEIMKPWYSNRKKYYGPHGEYTRYDYESCENVYYEVLEYYPVRVYLNQGIKCNFRMIANRLVVKRLNESKVVDRLCTCEYSMFMNY